MLLVEADARAAAVIRDNVRAIGAADGGAVDVRQDSVARVLSAEPVAAYDVAFLDPPYADAVDDDLQALVAHGWLAAGAVVVVERASRGPALQWPAGVDAVRSRRYGEATLWYGRRS